MPVLFLIVFLAGGALSQSSKWINHFLPLDILRALQQTVKKLGGSILFHAQKTYWSGLDESCSTAGLKLKDGIFDQAKYNWWKLNPSQS